MAAGDEFWGSLVAADVSSEDLTEWAMDETPTAGEHAAIVAAFDRWRTEEPAANERACTGAFNPGIVAPYTQGRADQLARTTAKPSRIAASASRSS